MKLLFGNFDFEHHLGPRGTHALRISAAPLNAELALSFVTIAQPGDLVWVPERPGAEYGLHLEQHGFPDAQLVAAASDVPSGAELCPWGWSDGVLDWGKQNGWHCDCPHAAVIATANSREFSSRLEREWNVKLPGACAVRSLDEFQRAVADAGRQGPRWVVKANFGMSARERFLGCGSAPDARAVQWVRKRIAVDGAVYFEPWVERIDEIGFQFTIPEAGQPVLEGMTPLLTGSDGTYRGSRLSSEREGLEPVVEIVTRAALKVQALGYFGPLGIDSMRYRTAEGEIRWRPLQDINARLTMGRLALGLRCLIRSGEHATWLHLRQNAPATDIEEHLVAALPAGTRAIRTSPLSVGDRPTSHRAILIAAPFDATLRRAEEIASRLAR